MLFPTVFFFFFFNDTATTEIYTLSLHDALPISEPSRSCPAPMSCPGALLKLGPERVSRLECRPITRQGPGPKLVWPCRQSVSGPNQLWAGALARYWEIGRAHV